MPSAGIPLVQEIAYQDPSALFFALSSQPWALFLDSANHQHPAQDTNRYSYIACTPVETLTLKNGVMGTEHGVTDPFARLHQRLSGFQLQKIADLPPFQGGVAGYFAYDLCHYLEQIPFPAHDDMNFPDMAVGIYDVVLSFDHHQQRAWVIATGFPESVESLRQTRARHRLDDVLAWLAMSNAQVQLPEGPDITCRADDIKTNFDQDSYVHMVAKARAYIRAGDISEVNLAQRFQVDLPQGLTPAKLYQRLRTINPAPFAAYLNCDDVVLASASPECFVSLADNVVTTRPIKGTRPRGTNPESDHQLAQDLVASEKDRAENIMIVDLMRNDLSRVCTDDSVIVEQCCQLESFATVHHLVSVIKGHLRPCQSAIDVLRALIPGGSITGAPKIRAMEIIAECEPNRRGPYCGNIGFISFNGDMNLSIAIRTFAIAQQVVTYQAGGAIVYDSDPILEYQESLAKARALTQALVNT
jgi:para-aminobenzoate synthetase component 1